MDFQKAYKPPKPFWSMSIPELVDYNNKCKRLDKYFLSGSPKKTPRSGGRILNKRRNTRNKKNRKTRRRKNKRTRRKRKKKLATIRTTNEHHSNQTETKT